MEPETGLTTAAALTKAAGPENSDAARGMELIAADTSIGTQEIEALGDSAYGSGELLAAITTAGRNADHQADAARPRYCRRVHRR